MPGLTRSSSVREESESPSEVSTISGGSNSNKRRKVSHNDLSTPTEDIDDSWALTPPRTVRAPRQNGATPSRQSPAHRPGMIVRIELKDFVTYTYAIFEPGPTLNLVLGPNGTGKSTLVCAICLGLGWGPSQLGRAANVGEFVKKGQPEAEIEIELKGHEGEPNVVCRRVIKAEGNKSAWYINGEQTNNKKVLECARSFNIQVDNLCHFLPQDRVVEFSRLEPVDRLTSTLLAAAEPQVIRSHEELKSKRADQRKLEKDLAGLKEQLKNLESRQEAQRHDVERLRERGEVRKRVEMLERIRPMADFYAAKTVWEETKKRHQDVIVEVKLLQRENTGPRQAANDKEAYRQEVASVMDRRQTFALKFEQQVKTKESERQVKETQKKDLDSRKKIAKDSEKKTLGDIARANAALKRLEEELKHEPPEFSAAEYNEKLREREREINQLSDESADLHEAGNRAAERLVELKRKILALQKDIERLQSKAGQQTNKLKEVSPDTYRAWEWIQENQSLFSGKVYGPPLIECSVTEMRYADMVESLLQKSEFMAITCTNSGDFRTLQKELYGNLRLHDVTLRTQSEPLDHPSNRAPLSPEDMHRYGAQGWAIDFLAGPDAVLAMLCSEARLHATAVFPGDISDEQYRRLTAEDKLSNWVTEKSFYKVQRRREYNASSTTVKALGKARYWTEQPIDGAAVNERKHDISAMQEEIEALTAEQAQRAELRKKKRASIDQLKSEKDEIEEEKAERQREMSNFRTIPAKIDGVKKQLERYAEIAKENEQTVKEVYKLQSDLMLAKGQLSIDIVRLLDAWRAASEQVVIAKVALAEAESEAETFKRIAEEREVDLNAKKAEKARLETLREKQREEARRLRRVTEALTDENEEVAAFFNNLTEAEQQRSPDDLSADIDAHRARLELLAGGHEGAITEWEERGRRIEEARNKAAEMDATLTRLQGELTVLRQQFEPRVDALIEQISAAFAASFARINCAGSVEVHKHGENGVDYDAWAINILVSFRGEESMSALDSHRQSGGERAVSTIFYLMALQSLSRAPFRVVDEINQGMDPRNERVVHDRLVKIACGEDTELDADDAVGHDELGGGSQYFLITPKLLHGLTHHDTMKVHTIASGEGMPDDPQVPNFRRLTEVRKAKNLASGKGRARIGIAAA